MSWIKVDTQGDGIGGTIESETWLNTDLIESISQYNLKVPRTKIKTQSGEEYYVSQSAAEFMREHSIGGFHGVDLSEHEVSSVPVSLPGFRMKPNTEES